MRGAGEELARAHRECSLFVVVEVPEPCRKARQARPLSLPQASRPSGLFKHIDPVSVALSAHPLRARPLSRDFEARCAQPGACVGGSGPGSKCRRGERATDLQYPATLAARFRVSHFVACCHAAQASPWGGEEGGEVARSYSSTTNHNLPTNQNTRGVRLVQNH